MTVARTTPENVDDRIEEWHSGKGRGLTLPQYLGWTWEQYKYWVESGEFPK